MKLQAWQVSYLSLATKLQKLISRDLTERFTETFQAFTEILVRVQDDLLIKTEDLWTAHHDEESLGACDSHVESLCRKGKVMLTGMDERQMRWMDKQTYMARLKHSNGYNNGYIANFIFAQSVSLSLSLFLP